MADKKKKRKKVHKKKRTKSRKKYKTKLSYVQNMIQAFLISSILFIGVASFFFSIEEVNGHSMKPNLTHGQKIIIEKEKNKFKRFDVIAFEDAKKIEVRRIIGIPGDSIRYENDNLYINEELITEKYIVDKINQASIEGKVFTQSVNGESVFRVKEIPKDYYFVLGDNRGYATDSRHYGFISKDRIKGIVM